MTGPDIPGYQPHPGVLDSEAAVAGACTISARHADAAAEILDENDFYDLGHAAVFTAACELSGRGAHVDATSIRNALIRNDTLRSLGGDGSRLLDLIHHAAPAIDGLRWHADVIRADAIRRRAHAACVRGVQITSQATFELEHIDIVLDELGRAAPTGEADRALWVDDDHEDFLDDLDKPTRETVFPTPWPDLDQHVKLKTGQVAVVAARPGGGKSLFGTQLAAQTAVRDRVPTLVMSMEMRRFEVLRRIYAAEAKVNLGSLNNHTLTDDDHTRIAETANRMRNAPLVIDDSSHTSLAHLRARLRWMARTAPAKLVIVDYLQLMISSRKAENRALEVAELTRGLKLLANELDVCVIALAQLNRGPEQRAGRKPTTADLRESGSIENDADTVLFTNMEPDLPNGGKRLGEIDIIIAKNRNGPHGIEIPLAFQGHYARFRPLAKPPWTPHDAARGAS